MQPVNISGMLSYQGGGRRAAVAALALMCGACAPGAVRGAPTLAASDSAAAMQLFRDNIDAIHKRDRGRYLATYLQTSRLGRNGPGGLLLGFDGWSARSDTTWPDTLVARDLKVLPIAPGVVYGTYCYTVTQNDTTTSGTSERIFVRTDRGWRIAVTTAFSLPAGTPAQCR